MCFAFICMEIVMALATVLQRPQSLLPFYSLQLSSVCHGSLLSLPFVSQRVITMLSKTLSNCKRYASFFILLLLLKGPEKHNFNKFLMSSNHVKKGSLDQPCVKLVSRNFFNGMSALLFLTHFLRCVEQTARMYIQTCQKKSMDGVSDSML